MGGGGARREDSRQGGCLLPLWENIPVKRGTAGGPVFIRFSLRTCFA